MISANTLANRDGLKQIVSGAGSSELSVTGEWGWHSDRALDS